MKPLLNGPHYTSPEIHQAELNHLFAKSWVFAGFTTDLVNDNDYITCKIGKESIIVQNFKGTLKAFLNVCTHRFSKLHTCKKGNRLLSCPYHGWRFNSEGLPTGIPDKEGFATLDDTAKDRLKLKSWEVDTCGKFVFIQKENDLYPSLNGFLGPEVVQLLQNLSAGMGPYIDTITMPLYCNWKISLENAIERYHVGPVHPTSFNKLGAVDKGIECQNNLHNSWNLYLNDDTLKKWKPIEKFFKNRLYQIDHFFHQYIFPNLAIGTTFGSTFSISSFNPLEPDHTEFECHMYGCDHSAPLRKVEESIAQAHYKSALDFNTQVFTEDKGICELVQEGAAYTQSEGILANTEIRICEFQKSYVNVMEKIKR